MFITIPHHSTRATLFQTECPAHLLNATLGERLGLV